MAYALTNPPVLIVQGGVGNQFPAQWAYNSVDGAAALVDAAGYFSNAKKLGMKVNDIVFVTDTDASPVLMTTHIVASIDATTGAANLTEIGATVGTVVGD